MASAEQANKRIVTIVLTGGPCAGKTTAINWIFKDLKNKGWKVLFVPEAATTLSNAGASFNVCGDAFTFQKAIFELELAQEAGFAKVAEALPADNVLIVFDRGIMDGKAYITSDQFYTLLEDAGLTEDQILARYDAVFHLVTTAKGAVDFYTTANNSARSETPEQAAALDDKLINAWQEHNHFCLIDNSGDFEEKMAHLLAEISKFLDK